MKKLIIIGDTHCNFKVIESIIEKEKKTGEVVAVLHAGDIGVYDEKSMERIPEREANLIQKHKDPIHEFFPYMEKKKSFPVPMYWIEGNHEDFELCELFKKDEKKIENFFPLNPGEITEIAFGEKCLKIAGLGKIVGLNKAGLTFSKYISEKEFHLAKQLASPDILLLHEPVLLSNKTKNNKWRSFGRGEITNVVKMVKPKLAFIGHMHFEYRIDIYGTKIYGLGYGVVGKYLTVDENLKVDYKAIDGKEIAFVEVKEGSLSYEEKLKLEAEERKMAKLKKKQDKMKSFQYGPEWLQKTFGTIIPRERKKEYAGLFMNISRLNQEQKSEEEIKNFARNWLDEKK